MPFSLRDGRMQLLAAYAALLAAGYATYLLPGVPYFRSGGELVFSLAIDVTLFAFVAKGSRVAVAIALGLNLLFFAAVFWYAVGPPAFGLAALLGVKVAETLVLVALWRTPRAAAGDPPAA